MSNQKRFALIGSITELETAGAGVIGDLAAYVDPDDDRLFGWDDSASAAIGFDLGAGLITSGTNVLLDSAIFTSVTTAQLTMAATEIELNGVLDFNGAADISGLLTVGGVLTVTSVGSATGAGGVWSSSATPLYGWNETDAAVDSRRWLLYVTGGLLLGHIRSDDALTSATWLRVERSGASTITEVELNGTLLDFNGNADISGTLVLTGASAGLGNPGLSSAGDITISKGSASLYFVDTAAVGADEDVWRMYNIAGTLIIATRTDANAAGQNVVTFSRTGTTATEIQFDATSFDLNANMTVPTGWTLTTEGGTFTIAGTGETLATFADDGAVTLYHNNTARVTTSSTGATITGDLTVNGGSETWAIIMSSAAPRLRFSETDATADNKEWYIAASAERLSFVIANDAFSTFGNPIIIDRTGSTVDLVQLSATEVDLTATTLDFNGNADISGTLSLHDSINTVDLADNDHALSAQGTNGRIVVYPYVTVGSGLVFTAGTAILSIDAGFSVYKPLTLRGTTVEILGSAVNIHTNLDVNGSLTTDGDNTLGGNTLIGNADISGTLAVTGASTLSHTTLTNAGATIFKMVRTDLAADNEKWRMYIDSGGQLFIAALNDAESAEGVAIAITRSGTTVTEVELNGTALDFNGNADISGSLTLGNYAEGAVELGTSGSFAINRSFKYKTADTDRASTTTMADDPHLAGWSLAASSYYLVEGYLEIISTSVTPDAKFSFQISSAETDGGYQLVVTDNTTIVGGHATAITTEAFIALAANTLRIVTFRGFVLTNAAATLDLQWAQNTSDAANTTFRRGSWIRVLKLGT